jgi:hypothetical protein
MARAEEPPPKLRRDTRLESEGAEFLVLGSLLAEGIPAWKAYTNFPGFDIAAGTVGKGVTCRIQVKSAFQTGSRGFQIKNFDSDFICFVRLNRGRSARRTRTANDGRQPPDIFVIPTRVAKRAWEQTDLGWAAVRLSRIRNPDQYLFAWGLIADFLKAKSRRGRT